VFFRHLRRSRAGDAGEADRVVTVSPMSRTRPLDDEGSGDRRRVPLWSIVAFAVVAGLGIGRFVTIGADDDTRAASEAPAFRSDLGQEDQIAALEARVATEPEDATAWRLLGTAYAGRAAIVEDPELYERAESAFARATALAPNDPATLVGRGSLALTLHQFPEAESLGERATAALPGNADALGVLVDAQVELGQYDAAAETLQEMLDARPGLPALARTSYLRQLNGDLDGAVEAMRRAAVAGASSPFDVAVVNTLLGDLHRHRGDLERATEAYADATADAPELVTAQAGTAWATAAAGDIDTAISQLDALISEYPSPSLALLQLDLQRGSGDDEAADDTAELVRAISVLQEQSGQVVDLEMALFEADEQTDPARGVALAERAQQVRPDNVFVDDAMAWALFRAGDSSAAATFMEEALRLGSAEPLMRYHAAEIAMANGDGDTAIEHLELALRDPWFSFRHRDRALDLADELGVVRSTP